MEFWATNEARATLAVLAVLILLAGVNTSVFAILLEITHNHTLLLILGVLAEGLTLSGIPPTFRKLMN